MADKQLFEWLNPVFFQGSDTLSERKLCCVNMVQSNTINEPYTSEQEFTHLLPPVCWFLFIHFSCHLSKDLPRQEDPSEEWHQRDSLQRFSFKATRA